MSLRPLFTDDLIDGEEHVFNNDPIDEEERAELEKYIDWLVGDKYEWHEERAKRLAGSKFDD